jgi:hypothetical protein
MDFKKVFLVSLKIFLQKCDSLFLHDSSKMEVFKKLQKEEKTKKERIPETPMRALRRKMEKPIMDIRGIYKLQRNEILS